MNKSKQSTQVSVISTDTSIPVILEGLSKELKALQKVADASPHTNGDLSSIGFQTNIKDETRVENLIRMNHAVSNIQAGYNKSADELSDVLGNTVPVFNINGCSVTDIKKDIRWRLQIILHDARKKELEELVKEAKEFMSTEDKKFLFAQKLAAKGVQLLS